MPGYSRTLRGRYGSPQGFDFNGSDNEAFGDGPPRSPGRPKAKTRKGQRAKKRPGKYATKRSRDFIEGQLYERDRMDGYRDPQQPAEGNYSNHGRFGPMRIGYRT